MPSKNVFLIIQIKSLFISPFHKGGSKGDLFVGQGFSLANYCKPKGLPYIFLISIIQIKSLFLPSDLTSEGI